MIWCHSDLRGIVIVVEFCVYVAECGGKMHLREGEFEKAHTDFFEAFKNYDESGSPRRTTCLKYLVLANMWVLIFFEFVFAVLRNGRCEYFVSKALEVLMNLP